jgi:large subunit ribosomal protein L21e
VQKGLPYKYYHGKTGVVFNVTKSAVGVLVSKPVGNRYLTKRISVRIEHVKPSKSRDDFLKRVNTNAEKRRQAIKDGQFCELKRKPSAPREASIVTGSPETVAPISFETMI